MWNRAAQAQADTASESIGPAVLPGETLEHFFLA